MLNQKTKSRSFCLYALKAFYSLSYFWLWMAMALQRMVRENDPNRRIE